MVAVLCESQLPRLSSSPTDLTFDQTTSPGGFFVYRAKDYAQKKKGSQEDPLIFSTEPRSPVSSEGGRWCHRSALNIPDIICLTCGQKKASNNQYKKKNSLYLFHILSLYLKTPAFIPEHRKSVFQIILDNFLLPVTVPIIKSYITIIHIRFYLIFKKWL